MKDRTYILSLFLGIGLTLAMAVAILLEAFAPAVVLPVMNIPNMAGLCLAVLLLEHYLVPDPRRCYLGIGLLAVLTFGLLPWAAGYVATAQMWKVALVGGVLFTLLTWLFDSIMDRITTGPKAGPAPVISAFGLYLAFQAFAGIIL